MIRKWPLIISVMILLFAVKAQASYEYTIRFKATNVVDNQNNFLLEYAGETYLIHHKTGCGEVLEGDELILLVRGEIDGNQDELRLGDSISCVVDQAELINGVLKVDDVTSADTYTVVLDENNEAYRIFYSSECAAIRNMVNYPVYVRRYGYQLQEGDQIFLSANEADCTLTHVQKIEEEISVSEVVESAESEQWDTKRPSTPENLRSIPRADSVYLYWDPAVDNEGISHYLISVSLYHMEDESTVDGENNAIDLPNTLSTGGDVTSFKVENLEPDELYFFRVIAVDRSANWSSRWSNEETAMTRSSIIETSLETTPVKASVLYEINRYFHIEWSEPSNVTRRIVELWADGKRIYSNSNWQYNKIRPLKRDDRKGKKLELVIKVYDFRGHLQEDRVEFSF